MARKYFTIPFLTFRGRSTTAAPPLSRADESRLYFDTNTELLMVSNDGYDYLPLGTGTIAGSQQDTAILTIATGKTVEVYGYQYAGATSVDGSSWVDIIFESVASATPEGIEHYVQLWDMVSASEIVVHQHIGTSPNKISTPVAISGERLIEVRHKLVGSVGDGYSGLLGSAQLYLSNRDGILVAPPDNGVLNRSPISIIGADYIPTTADAVILVNAISAPITVTLPSVSTFDQYYFTIKKIDTSTNAVTVVSADLIDGDGSMLLENEDHGITVHSNGTNWYVTRDTNAGNSGAEFSAPIVAKTTAYIATTSDHTILCDASAGAFTVTLPSAISAYSAGSGLVLYIKKIDSSANVITVDADAAELIDGTATQTLSFQNEAIAVQSDGSAWWII